MLIEHTSLTRTASAILEGAGAPRPHADAVAQHLVEANLKGHDSHGVGM
ncbi:MAG: malate dehydrogenase, partial [Gammaproteobacteria bacterium]|nr:malate dehydrogenase [Gammaproteobacteria bacterium]